MKKHFTKLTKAQRARGVIFSSTLSTSTVEQPTDIIHEVTKNDTDWEGTIERLMDDTFFHESPYRYNIIRR